MKDVPSDKNYLSLGLNADVLENMDELVGVVSEIFSLPIVSLSVAGGGQFITIASRGELDVTEDCKLLFDAILVNQGILFIEDAALDSEFENLIVMDGQPKLRFIAGYPLHLNGSIVGVLFLADTSPKKLSDSQKSTLKSISRMVERQLNISHELDSMTQERNLIEISPIVQVTWNVDNGLKLTQVSKNCERILGISHKKLLSGNVTIQDILTNESEAHFYEAIHYHQEGALTNSCKLCIHSASKNVWLSMLSNATFNSRGNVINIQAFLFDTSEQKYIEDRLNETNQRMRLLLEASELGTWDWNITADVNQVNRKWCDMLGLSIEDFDTSVRFFRQLIHPADIQRVDKTLSKHLSGEIDVYSAQLRMRHADGHWVWIETYGKVVERDGNGQPMRLAGIHRDITQRMEQELTEKKKTQLLSFINKARANYLRDNDLTSACQAILPELIEITDSQFAFIGEIIESASAQRLFIHAISDISWDDVSSQLVQRYRERDLYFDSFDNLFGQVIVTGEKVLSNSPASHPASRGTPKGHPRINRFMGLPIKLKDKTVGMIGLANKATPYIDSDAIFMQPLLDALSGLFYAVGLEMARAKAEERLLELAMTDALSGLPNRRAFIEHSKMLEENDVQCCIGIIDIDFFKKVNDTYGHDAGDEVIKSVANKIHDSCRSDDYLARLGGEEFAVILANNNQQDAHRALEKMRHAVESMSINYKEHNLFVTISIGAVEVMVCQSGTISDHINLADKALYQAKDSGRNRICWYES
ncbi:diguanylate cyclase [Aestuariibacter salexigens]|uniref:sensor domain-containing diguanylate cyclase n=1 Tax=Aestuariibacter salexigens TaxID=226010 RepID=UPI0004273186|nr:diguanylate cyclase [Aestuariibacter salexigens]